MTNVILINKFVSLKFSAEDKEYLDDLCHAFAAQGLPHELVYGMTDEEQEWCLVRKITSRREADSYTPDSYIVAEVTVVPMGYRHNGNWGNAVRPTLRGLFDHVMPNAYNEVKKRVK